MKPQRRVRSCFWPPESRRAGARASALVSAFATFWQCLASEPPPPALSTFQPEANWKKIEAPHLHPPPPLSLYVDVTDDV